MTDIPNLRRKLPLASEDVPHPCEVPGCPNAPVGDQAYSLRVALPCPGPGIGGTMLCQHWGCCPQHAYDLLIACLHQHALDFLKQAHEEKGYETPTIRTVI